jgi:hypothetical protein
MFYTILLSACVSGPNSIRQVFKQSSQSQATVQRDVAGCKMHGSTAYGGSNGSTAVTSARMTFRYCMESKGYTFLRQEWYEGPFEGDVFAHRFAAAN